MLAAQSDYPPRLKHRPTQSVPKLRILPLVSTFLMLKKDRKPPDLSRQESTVHALSP